MRAHRIEVGKDGGSFGQIAVRGSADLSGSIDRYEIVRGPDAGLLRPDGHRPTSSDEVGRPYRVLTWTQSLSGASDRLVRDEGEAVANGRRVDEPQGLPVGGLTEEALAGAKHDREDHEPELIDEVVLD